MKQWINKLLAQFDLNASSQPATPASVEISDDRATLLYLLDSYSQHLIDIEKQPIRKTREVFDDFVKQILADKAGANEKILFRLRQFFSSYRLEEVTYIQKTFEDFKRIIWDFADQLGEDLAAEQTHDHQVKRSLAQLREAVESNSIDVLRSKSREFIDMYTEIQTRKDERRSRRVDSIQKNLHSVKKQLLQANQSMREDHLTGAFNRKSFDEQAKKHISLLAASHSPATLVLLDIDYFKKINDTYGHDVGDCILKECVRHLKQVFQRPTDFVARIGGEEFAVILPDFKTEHAVKKVEDLMQLIRRETYVHESHQIKFTISAGIAELKSGEDANQWLKRADLALYQSKNSGRNKWTVSGQEASVSVA